MNGEPPYGVFPMPLGGVQLEPGKPFTLSCRSQVSQRLRPERLVLVGYEWSRKGVCTCEGLYVESIPLGGGEFSAFPLDVFGPASFGVRLATGGMTIGNGQLFELRGRFDAFPNPPPYWSRLAGPPRERPWPPRYWSNRAGSLWPDLQAMLLVRFVESH